MSLILIISKKISDFKIPIDFLKGVESKNEDLEEKLMNQEQEQENNFSIVQKIIECIISQNQSIFLFISACFMMLMLLIELLIVIILEDYGKNLLISGSFLAGGLISFIMQFVLLQTGIKGTILVLMQAK